jgi:hypothetical protein
MPTDPSNDQPQEHGGAEGPGVHVEVAGFQQGGIEKTGLAWVHEGEEIRVPPAAQARIHPAEAGGGEVHYEFPIEIVVIGEIPESEKQALEERIWVSLDRALA